MKPYYEHAGITIYHGDCRDIVPAVYPRHSGDQPRFDVLLTDPPYGIGEASGKNVSRTNLAPARDYGISDWDNTCTDALPIVRAVCRWHLIFGGNYYDLPPSSCWLVWDKQNSGDFADAELIWTNLPGAVRLFAFRWNGMLQGCYPKEVRVHPTQKPLAVIRWVLGQVPSARSVFDPFMGSGSTLVEAKRLGLTAVGIEREESYCELAAERMSQDVLPFEAVKTPTQLALVTDVL